MPNEGNYLVKIVTFIKTHKKLILVTAASIFLFAVLGLTIFQAFRSKFFPIMPPIKPFQNITQNTSSASIQIRTSKDTYSLSEKVPIKVFANSGGQAVRAFDVMIEYDPNYLSLTNKKSPTKPQFQYYGKNTGSFLLISAVQKPNETGEQIFNNSALFEFEFAPKKAGKTNFKVIFAPNATNESNLIDKNSKDILRGATGKEIEIK